jgi:hypothetical protein
MRRNNALDHEQRVGGRPSAIVSTPDAILSAPERPNNSRAGLGWMLQRTKAAPSSRAAKRRGDPGERRAPDVSLDRFAYARDDGAPLTPGLAVTTEHGRKLTGVARREATKHLKA